jgi:hypothetical protein
MADPVAIISVSTTGLVAGLSLLKDVVLPRWQSSSVTGRTNCLSGAAQEVSRD